MTGGGATWEYRDLSLPRGTSRETARTLLTGVAETLTDGAWSG